MRIGRVAAVALGGHVVLTWGLAARRGRAKRRTVAGPETNEVTRSAECATPVSVLIPAWRERGTIERCIRSLQQIAYPEWEAIVIAGGADGTYDASRSAVSGDTRFRIIEQPPRGKNAALNMGLSLAQHDLVVLLDADSEVRPDWLTELIAPLAAESANVAIGRFAARRRNWITCAEEMGIIEAYAMVGSSSLQGSASIAIRRAVLEKLGGFAEDVPVGVDWDLGVRVETIGESVAFAENALLSTDRPATLGESWHNEVRWRRAHLSGLWRHREMTLKSPRDVIRNLYFYGLSMAFTAASLSGLFLGFFQKSRRRSMLERVGILVFWLLGRRAAQGMRLARYTGDSRWLRLSWAPALMLPQQMGAAVWALLTVGETSPHFKGPRSSTDQEKPFDPMAIDTSNALDYAGFLVAQSHPGSIHLVTDVPAVATAAIARIPTFDGRLVVDSEPIREAAARHYKGAIDVGGETADLEWHLFPVRFVDQGAPTVVVVERNALSHRTVLDRDHARAVSWLTSRRLAKGHSVSGQAGVITPPFLCRWILSLLAGTRFPGHHFLLGQQAMDHVVDLSPLWRFGTVVVLRADRNQSSSNHAR